MCSKEMKILNSWATKKMVATKMTKRSNALRRSPAITFGSHPQNQSNRKHIQLSIPRCMGTNRCPNSELFLTRFDSSNARNRRMSAVYTRTYPLHTHTRTYPPRMHAHARRVHTHTHPPHTHAQTRRVHVFTDHTASHTQSFS